MPVLTATQHWAESLARAVRQGKEVEGIWIVTKEASLPMFADDTILFVENPKESRKNMLELINTFSRLKLQINIQKSNVLQYTSNK